jgi:hypothetical protein
VWLAKARSSRGRCSEATSEGALEQGPLLRGDERGLGSSPTHALAHGVEALVVGQLGYAAELAELAIALVVQMVHVGERLAVLRPVHPVVAADQRVVGPMAAPALARQPGVAELPGLQPRERAVARSVHALADAAALPRDERGHDAERHHRRAPRVRERHAREIGRVLGPAGHAGRPATRLREQVVHGPGRVRTRRTEAVDRAVDQPRVDLRERVVVQLEAAHGVFAKVGEEDVGRLDQLVRDGAALARAQVELQMALAAVGGQILGAPGRLFGKVDRAEVEAGAVAGRRLDLDDLRTHVGQERAGQRALDPDSQLDDTDPFQRSRHARDPLCDVAFACQPTGILDLAPRSRVRAVVLRAR